MKKIISYCLWGDNPKYNFGAIRNAELAYGIFPDWKCRFYCYRNTDPDTVSKLSHFSHCEIVFNDKEANWTAMLDRFLAVNDCDIFLSRDVDSRLSFREEMAVREWIDSNKGFSTLHDHYNHSVPILGGLWGIKRDVIPAFQSIMQNWINQPRDKNGNYWQVDQQFLTQEIWPRVKDNCLRHDDGYYNHIFGEAKPFPTPFDGVHFVGATYGHDNKIDKQQVDELQNFLRKRKR